MLESVRSPDLVHRRRRDASPRRHRAFAPVGGVRRLVIERQVHASGATVSTLLPTLVATSTAPMPSPAKSTICDRYTIFCGVLRSFTSFTSRYLQEQLG